MAGFDMLDKRTTDHILVRTPVTSVRLMLQVMSEVGVEFGLFLRRSAAARFGARPFFHLVGLFLIQPQRVHYTFTRSCFHEL